MIAEYSFFLAFTLQILVLSVLYPQLLVRRASLLMQTYPESRYPQLYSLRSAAIDRNLRWYRALNWAIVFIGALLLVGFYRTMQTDWDDGPVETLVAV